MHSVEFYDFFCRSDFTWNCTYFSARYNDTTSAMKAITTTERPIALITMPKDLKWQDAQCANLWIFLWLIFYVKSNLGNLDPWNCHFESCKEIQVSVLVNLHISRKKFRDFPGAQILRESNFGDFKRAKITIFTFFEPLTSDFDCFKA